MFFFKVFLFFLVLVILLICFIYFLVTLLFFSFLIIDTFEEEILTFLVKLNFFDFITGAEELKILTIFVVFNNEAAISEFLTLIDSLVTLILIFERGSLLFGKGLYVFKDFLYASIAFE